MLQSSQASRKRLCSGLRCVNSPASASQFTRAVQLDPRGFNPLLDSLEYCPPSARSHSAMSPVSGPLVSKSSGSDSSEHSEDSAAPEGSLSEDGEGAPPEAASFNLHAGTSGPSGPAPVLRSAVVDAAGSRFCEELELRGFACRQLGEATLAELEEHVGPVPEARNATGEEVGVHASSMHPAVALSFKSFHMLLVDLDKGSLCAGWEALWAFKGSACWLMRQSQVHGRSKPCCCWCSHCTHQVLIIECDAVILGSGCGGAVVAAQLAQARPGSRILVLDKGRYFAGAEFSQLEAPSMAEL